MGGFAAGFRSLNDERTDVALPVDGDVPDWLDGSLLRNGPAWFETGTAPRGGDTPVNGAGAEGGDRVDHWFDGLAMVHRFGFDAGEVTYTNRFLRSDAFEAARRGNSWSAFATGDGGGVLSRLREFVLGDPPDNANVHVARLGGEYVALTETPRGITFDPTTLETTGHAEFSGATVHHVVAHLRRDDARGETVGVGVRFGPRTAYTVFRIPDGTRRRETVATIRRRRPAYLHDLAVTPEHVVIVEPPFVVDPKRLLLGDGAFVDHYEWRPDRGTSIVLVDRETGAVSDHETDPRFVFHLTNAYEKGRGEQSEARATVVDAVTYEDASIVSDLYLDEVEATPMPANGTLRRYRIRHGDSAGDDGVGGTDSDAAVESEALYEGTELPRFSPEVVGEPYRYVYGQATGREGVNGLVKVDVETGENREWWEEGLWAEEPVFVPEPGADREDAGAVLATALDEKRDRTVLLILEGTTFTERARLELPHVVPFGFHGRFFPEV